MEIGFADDFIKLVLLVLLMKGKVAVIGYGSTIRSDDSAGIVVMRGLERRFHANKNVEFFEMCQGVDLLAMFEKFDRIIMIDSGSMNKRPGEFGRFRFSELKQRADTSISHSLQFSLIGEIAGKMGYRMPEIVVYIIQPRTMNIGEKLSPEVKIGVKRMIPVIEEELLSILGNRTKKLKAGKENA